jgi:hypothetical protein
VLANAGYDTRSLLAYLGHSNIQHTVGYAELAPDRFKHLWKGEKVLAARRRGLADLLAGWHPEQHPDVLALIGRLARALTSNVPAPQ